MEWVEALEKYENFLRAIPLGRYSELRSIKTVEQDLPRGLNPLPLIYEFYWVKKNFVSFDEFFVEYWRRSIRGIKEFKQKYFWGCTDDFIMMGFRARLYRTWTSVLTQFHFMYLWNSLFEEKVIANAELDMEGVDGRVHVGNYTYDLQVKKISYRKEAGGERRFTRRKRKEGSYIFEILYIVDDPKEVEERLKRARKNKQLYEIELKFFNNYLSRLENGFVIFKKEYAQRVRKLMIEKPGDYIFKSILDLEKLF